MSSKLNYETTILIDESEFNTFIQTAAEKLHGKVKSAGQHDAVIWAGSRLLWKLMGPFGKKAEDRMPVKITITKANANSNEHFVAIEFNPGIPELISGNAYIIFEHKSKKIALALGRKT